MSGALWKLVWMRYRATVRRLFVGSAKRLVMTVAGGAVIVLWLASVVIGNVMAPRQDMATAPATMIVWIATAMVLMPMVGVGRRASGAFTPAEVDQLFPAPFTRRELMLYKIVFLTGVGVLASLWMSLLLSRHGRSWGQAFIGVFVVMQAATLTGLIGEQLRSGGARRGRVRAAIIGLLGLLLAGAAGEAMVRWGADMSTAASRLHTTICGRVLCAPGLAAVGIMRGAGVGEVVGWIAASLCGLAVLVAAAVRLGESYSETLVAQAERQEKAREQFLRSGVIVADPESAAKRTVAMLPRWGGIGPVAWRQLVTLRRSNSLRLLLVVLVLVVVFVVMLPGGEQFTGVGGVAGAMLLFMLPNLFRMDFRGDIDHIDVLKSLPIPAWRVAAGQVLTPTLLIGVAVGAVLVIAAARGGAYIDTCAALAVAAAPAALLMVALENLVFLLSPTRVQSQTPGSPQAIGRGVLMTLARLGAMVVVAAPAVPAAMLTYSLTSWLAGAVLVTSAVLALAAAACVGLVAWAFTRFDVSRDMPG